MRCAAILVDVRLTPSDLTAWTTSGDGPLNVLRFVPVGFLLALLLRRPVRAAAAAMLLSLAIECYQASLSTRVGAFAGVANGVGAAIGATAAALVLALAPTGRDRTAGRGGVPVTGARRCGPSVRC